LQAVEDGGERALAIEIEDLHRYNIHLRSSADEPYTIGPMSSVSRPFPPRNYNCGQSSKLLACHMVEPRGISETPKSPQLTALFTALNPCTKFAMLRYATAMESIVPTYAHLAP